MELGEAVGLKVAAPWAVREITAERRKVGIAKIR
jgi:hypothetical protein